MRAPPPRACSSDTPRGYPGSSSPAARNASTNGSGKEATVRSQNTSRPRFVTEGKVDCAPCVDMLSVMSKTTKEGTTGGGEGAKRPQHLRKVACCATRVFVTLASLCVRVPRVLSEAAESSILDHDLDQLCRGRRIQMSGHSDLGILNNL